MMKFNLVVIASLIYVFGATLSYAKNCEGSSTHNWLSKAQNGETIEYTQKSKINSICNRRHTSGGAFIDLSIIEYPKGIFDFVTRPYEFAFRFNKVGKYTIKYDIKLQDRYGKTYIGHFIMYADVVSESW